jgi:hypothetical protein
MVNGAPPGHRLEGNCTNWERYSSSLRFSQEETISEQDTGRFTSAADSAYFTFEKSAGIRTSLPSCRLTTNTEAALGSKFS